jgi:hypothetical protein
VSTGSEISPHQIRRRDVAAWLAGSAIQAVTYHRTSHASAFDIRNRGVDLTRSQMASFGEGFYTATTSDPLRGPAEVVVAIRTLRPLIGTPDDVGAMIDGLARLASPRDPSITPEVAAEIRRHLIDLGYDGIIVEDADDAGVDYVVAIAEGSVRVVID